TSINGGMKHGTIGTRQIHRLLASSQGAIIAKRELECDALSAHVDGEYGHDDHATPLRRFFQLLKLEASDVWAVVLFALVSGVLAMATPLAVESLVNVVRWGTYVQPLVVLALILLAALGLAGVLKVLQTVVVEIIQRRQFVRIVSDLAHRFPRAKRSYLRGHYPRELANRIFDIMTIQKATAVLLLDGVSILLTTGLGMLLLAFYHPYLLGFNAVLLLTMLSITWLLGRGGIRTSIDESKAKYKIVHWLQDVISFPGAFKVNGGEALAIERANTLAAEYLVARESQFKVVIRQVAFAIGLQVLASTAILGLGGYLVINRQLTLGQLVASELVVTVVVGAFAKAGKSLEKFYDLMAGIDKVGHLLDIPVDLRRGRESLPDEAVSIEWQDLQLSLGNNRRHLRANRVECGECVAVVGEDTTTQTLLVRALAGLTNPDAGAIEIAGMSATEAADAGLGRLVAIAQDIEIFHATVAENVELGRNGIGQDKVRAAFCAVGLSNSVRSLPDGWDTILATDGEPLTRDQRARLMLARAIVVQPRVLLIDRLLDELPKNERRQTWRSIKEFVMPCSIVLTTADSQLANECDRQVTTT
ncbi:MAG: ATP-binding cassette domain-containing protein, partial [Planctomycetales bacterium]|nr:ATP-binding cassette domain-containing protein [Planctomycetales bacterium]